MDLKLPKLGEGADSGVVVSILVKEGDRIEEGQTLLELENEKAVAPIPASASGTVTRIQVKEGDKISVGQVILTLAVEGESPAAVKPSVAPPEAVDEEAALEPSEEPAAPPKGAIAAEPGVALADKPSAKVAAAPALRKLARELGIDLTRVRGTERGGRIGMADVRRYLEALQKLAFEARSAAAPAKRAAPVPIDFSKWGPITQKPLSQLRQVIARRMLENWTTIPHVTQFDEADITGLMDLRGQYAPQYEAKGARLTVTGFVCKAVVTLLRQHPLFNSSLDETTGALVLKQYYHLGVAVDTDAGLIVPVIRDADRKSLPELSQEIETLAAKARERKVSLEELNGGTFTISNQGGIGSGHFTPIVNKPEVAILGLGRAARKAVVRDKKTEARMMLPLALSYDHRVIDGGVAARFMVDLVQALEHFSEDEVKLR
jgi:pyruvate dehydrogenase E2 component (dihydrolipoamide acetyltransferase)